MPTIRWTSFWRDGIRPRCSRAAVGSQLGGHVVKDEESTIVIFWKVEDLKQRGEDLDTEQSNEKNRRQFMLRYYRVFNLEQCKLPQAVLDKLPKI